jgi:hypothetical protein
MTICGRVSAPRYRTGSPNDVVGSPYCVRGYIVDDHLGGRFGTGHRTRQNWRLEAWDSSWTSCPITSLLITVD